MVADHVIIGCGPAGLAVGARMRLASLTFEMLEASSEIGHSWRHHYDRLHLHTVKQFSYLPHEPFPDDYPVYVSRQQLVEYMDSYARKYDLRPHFGSFVTNISREKEIWCLDINGQPGVKTRNVIVASGVNRLPKIPRWPGQESFSGQIVHSKKYKNALPYKNKKVLVVGMGNTGAELALDLAEAGVTTDISVRSAISIVPRDLNGRPVQVTSKQLAKLPFGLGDWLGNQIRKVYFGNLEKYGLKASPMPPAVQLRQTGKTPVIDIGAIAAIKEGKIQVRPDIERLESGIVIFVDGTMGDYDVIILATGYDAGIERIIPGIDPFLDSNGLPRSPIGTDNWEGLFFIGYDNYKLGGILGTIHTDSQTIVEHLKNKK